MGMAMREYCAEQLYLSVFGDNSAGKGTLEADDKKKP